MDKVKKFFKKIPLILWAILLLVVIFSLKSDRYFTLRNLVTLMQQGAALLIVASAASFIIISGGLDLSLGAILTVSGITTALCVNAGLPIIVAVVAGALIGIYNGWKDMQIMAFASACAVMALSSPDATSGMKTGEQIKEYCKKLARREVTK